LISTHAEKLRYTKARDHAQLWLMRLKVFTSLPALCRNEITCKAQGDRQGDRGSESHALQPQSNGATQPSNYQDQEQFKGCWLPASYPADKGISMVTAASCPHLWQELNWQALLHLILSRKGCAGVGHHYQILAVDLG
jgi:hypothetical protein